MTSKNLTQLVLGNGFDVYLQLPTRYRDFFEHQKLENPDYIIFYAYLNRCSWNNGYGTIAGPSEAFDAAVQKLSENFSLWDAYFLLLGWIYEKEPLNTNAFGGDKDWREVESQISRFLSPASSLKAFAYSIVADDYVEKASHPNYRSANPIEGGCSPSYFLALLMLKRFNEKERWDFGHNNCYPFALAELKKFERLFSDYIAGLEIKYPAYKSDSIRFVDSFFNEWIQMITVETFNFTKIYPGDRWNSRNIHGIAGVATAGVFGIETLADGRPITPEMPQYIFTKTLRELELEINGNIPASTSHKPQSLVIFGHSLNEQDQGYFFDLFDAMQLWNPDETSTVTFAFCLFDEKREEELKKDRLVEATGLINRYEKYRNNYDPNFRNKGSLLSRLLHTGRILFQQVPRYKEEGAFNYKK